MCLFSLLTLVGTLLPCLATEFQSVATEENLLAHLRRDYVFEVDLHVATRDATNGVGYATNHRETVKLQYPFATGSIVYELAEVSLSVLKGRYHTSEQSELPDHPLSVKWRTHWVVEEIFPSRHGFYDATVEVASLTWGDWQLGHFVHFSRMEQVLSYLDPTTHRVLLSFTLID